MILLALVAVTLLLSLLSGGRLERLAQVQFRASYLILLSFLVQLLVFSAPWQERVGAGMLSDGLYALSLALLLLAVWLNRHTMSIVLLGMGLALNAAVILANGGHMPTSLQALQTAGIVDARATFEEIRVTNSSLIDAQTPLWFLGDVFAVPRGWPLANIFSLGDLLILVGAMWFVWSNTRVTPERRLVVA